MLRAGFILVATLAAIIAMLDNSVYDLFAVCADIVYIIIFPQLTVVLFSRWQSANSCLVGSAFGLLLRILAGESRMWIPTLLKYPFYDYEKHEQLFPYKTFAMLANLGLTMLIAFVESKKNTGGIQQSQHIPKNAVEMNNVAN